MVLADSLPDVTKSAIELFSSEAICCRVCKSLNAVCISRLSHLMRISREFLVNQTAFSIGTGSVRLLSKIERTKIKSRERPW